MSGAPRALLNPSTEAVRSAPLISADTHIPTVLRSEPQHPADFYRTRLKACEADTKRLDRRHLLIGLLRLVWVVAALMAGWFSLARHRFAWEWIIAPLLAFAVTARWHARVTAATEAAWKATRFYEHGLARLEERWRGVRPRTTRVNLSESLYAGDLDVFGPGSLFELLCTARTTVGEDTLAGWLLAPAAPEEVRARQAAVAELRERTDLRERFACAPGKETLQLDAHALSDWGESQEIALWPAMRWWAPLELLLLFVVVWRCVAVQSAVLLWPLLLLNLGLTYAQGKGLKKLFAQTEGGQRRLAAVGALFAIVEHEPFHAPLLRQLQEQLGTGGRGASAAMRRLGTLAAVAEQRLNWLSRLFDLLFLFSVQLALFVERWQKMHGRKLRPWLQALGEFEALLSLSAYAFENPDDAFPEVVTGGVVFRAEALSHPLLPRAVAVRNDVSLDEQTRLLLISGSNMSGKSTLLRSTGVAAIMALAGAPVRARQLRLSPFHVAASMQINDSLEGGRSHFYAEILRLRAVCTLARSQPPVLFLLDELLAGTNSHDRVAGATGVVQELLSAGAVGLLSTHDLALTQLPEPLTGRIRNAHFEDQVAGGELHFDYLLRDGVVTRSNGLALMRMIGLDV